MHTTNFGNHQSSSFNHQLDICVCMSCNFSIFGSPNYYQHQSSIVHLCTFVHVLHVLHYWLPIIAKWYTSNLMSSQPWQRKNASFRMSFPIKETCFLVPSMFSVHTFYTDWPRKTALKIESLSQCEIWYVTKIKWKNYCFFSVFWPSVLHLLKKKTCTFDCFLIVVKVATFISSRISRNVAQILIVPCLFSLRASCRDWPIPFHRTCKRDFPENNIWKKDKKGLKMYAIQIMEMGLTARSAKITIICKKDKKGLYTIQRGSSIV